MTLAARPRQGLDGLEVLALAVASPVVLARAQNGTAAPRLTWAIYPEINGRPSFFGREFLLGESRRVVIASSVGLMGSFEALPLQEPPPQVRWSVEPSGEGVTISRDGVVMVAMRATPGIFTVRADASSERRTLDLLVYDPMKSPLVGRWAEIAQIACEDGREFQPARLMPELIFRANGEFTATWFPFETRIDYGGKYDYDIATGTLMLAATGPSDLKPKGVATIDGDRRLVLKNVWLGTPPRGRGPGADPAPAVPSCGHVFQFASRW
jgi:hypothetical protein